MKYIKGVKYLVFGLALLYILSKANLIIGRELFALLNRFMLKIDSLSPNLPKFRVLTEIIVQFGFLAGGFFLFKKIGTKNIFYLSILILYPIFFDISNIICDSSCVKAWIHPNKLCWYLPIRLLVILASAFTFFKIKNHIKGFEIFLFLLLLVLYQFIRPY